jgi:ATP-dependent RNA helicase DHX57
MNFSSKSFHPLLLLNRIKKGFREAHVDEALQYRSNLSDLHDWLAIHVPEDDLPISQRPKDHKSIVLSNQTPEELSRQYMVDRLHAVGFSRYDCRHALEACSFDEYHALVHLCHILSGLSNSDLNQDAVSTADEVKDLVEEERQVLESIYENVQHEVSDIGQKFTISIEQLEVSICIPHSLPYPHRLPGLSLTSTSYPAYIRLAVLKRVYVEASSSFLGSPMIFSILGSIEQCLPEILSTPPPLTSLYRKGDKMDLSNLSSHKSSKPKNSKTSKRHLNLPSSAVLKKELLEKRRGDIQYKSMQEVRQKLPSFKFKANITNSLTKNQCLIICGETGCGKSTQTGQFILDDLIERDQGQECYIICTQPRRISATSLAERVAAERAEVVGNQIGCSIRGESKQSVRTQLLFCTNGVLLRMIQEDVELAQVSHIIIDEVHERGAESDFLLVLLRDLLPKRPDLKVVLMSATIDATTISSYFDNCPILEVPGRTFPVTDHYLEDVLAETGYIPENTSGIKTGSIKKNEDESTSDADDWSSIFQRVGSLNLGQKNKIIHAEKSAQFQIDYGLIAACVKWICSTAEEGAILIFLPVKFSRMVYHH